MLIDSHANVSSLEMQNIDDLLQRAQEAGVCAIVNICTDEASLVRGIQLASSVELPKIYLTAATTPHDVLKDGEYFFPICAKAAKEKKLVAVGETGLDYYYEHAPRDIQREYLQKYLALAIECDLPAVIHCREAFDDFFAIWDEAASCAKKPLRGVLHCFTGTIIEAKHGLDRNLYISMSGIVTFPKSTELREVAKYVPQDMLFIETDSPYLAPQGHRGKKNEPAYLIEIAKVVAELKGMTVEALGRVTAKNTAALFKM